VALLEEPVLRQNSGLKRVVQLSHGKRLSQPLSCRCHDGVTPLSYSVLRRTDACTRRL
jgi:hypothetical protein